MSTVALFCRTYYKDAERLNYLLTSVEMFCKNIDEVIVCGPPSSHDALAPVVSQFEFAKLVASDTYDDDYIGQQITKLTAHRHTAADYILHVDADCIFHEPYDPYDWIENGKPILYHAPYNYFYKHNIHVPWQSPTSELLGSQADNEFMRQFPMMFPRELYEQLAVHFEATHGFGIDDIQRKVHGDLLSEFNLMGAFSFKHGRRFNRHYNQLVTGARPAPLTQMCLNNVRNDRTLVTEDIAVFESVFGVGIDDALPRTHLKALPQRDRTEPVAASATPISPSDAATLDEMETFRKAELWNGGYVDADPLTPLSWSSYSTNGFVSVYYATYIACIRPYVKPGYQVMEIGPGRGVWTRALIEAGADRVYALDVQDRATNEIDAVLGQNAAKLEYIVVQDFSGEGVPDQGIDLFFSFGTFVHLSRNAQAEYVATLARKMKSGAHGFIQFADVEVWNSVVTNPELKVHSLLSRYVDDERREMVQQALDASPIIASREPVDPGYMFYDTVDPGRYFYVGTDWLAAELEQAGFEIQARNVVESLRDPVIHFVRR